MELAKTTAVRTVRVVVRAEDGGLRLDQVLAARVPDLSRRRARFLVAAGSVYVDGRRASILSRRLDAGQEVVCHLHGMPAEAVRRALDAALLLHEDSALVAIDKPAGVPSHPTLARRAGTALQLLEELCRGRAGEKVPLWPLHRLDTDTSGVLVFAKSKRAARAIHQAFARRYVRKRYVAVVAGVPDPPEREITLPLVEGHLRTTASESGKEATTRYRVLEPRGDRALVELEPATGRMHQIRVHLAAIGHPVVGDRKYGPGLPAERLFLHASSLELPHPDGGALLVIESPPPREFAMPEGEP
jgi:23S rRNA pseudouridine1911/1915/1917 synthase